MPPRMPPLVQLDLRADAIVPIAMPPGRESYNIDSGRGLRRPSTVAACSLPAGILFVVTCNGIIRARMIAKDLGCLTARNYRG